MNHIPPQIIIVPYSVIVTVIDLLTKYWAFSRFSEAPWHPFSSIPWFSFTASRNFGIAFGLPFGGFPLIVVSCGVLIILAFYADHFFDLKRHLNQIALGLMIGGAIGNLVDRIQLGFVRDFIALSFWPTFNVADGALVIGTFMLGFMLMSQKNHGQKGR